MSAGEKISFIFAVDVSGSMYGQKIASANAVLRECLDEIKNINDTGRYELKVSVVTFADKMWMNLQNKDGMNVISPKLEVKKNPDGFYPITSFGSLYRGLQVLFGDQKFSVERGDKHTFLFLITDAKPVDQFAEDFHKLNSMETYKKTAKYVAVTDDQQEKYSNVTVEFVDYKADRIVRMSDLPNEIRKIKIAEFSGMNENAFGSSSNSVYDEIFV